MKSNYVIWDAYVDKKKNFCVLDDLDNVEDDFELTKGIPRLLNFPNNAVFSMDPEYPKNIVLADNAFNVNELIVVSKALKEFIAGRNIKNVEYLPVTILNHKNRVAAKDYFIVHPIYLQDGLMIQESGCTWSEIIKDKVNEVTKLVIDETRIDPDVVLFRLQHFYRPVLVRRDLAEAVSAEAFTGIRWIELDEYPED